MFILVVVIAVVLVAVSGPQLVGLLLGLYHQFFFFWGACSFRFFHDFSIPLVGIPSLMLILILISKNLFNYHPLYLSDSTFFTGPDPSLYLYRLVKRCRSCEQVNSRTLCLFRMNELM